MCDIFKNKYEKLGIAGFFLQTIILLCKSITFNLFVFILGFFVGFSVLATKVHFCSTENPKYENIQKLEHLLNEQRILDMKIDETISKIKINISHEEYLNCK